MAASVTKDACTGATCVPLFRRSANESLPTIQAIDFNEYFSGKRFADRASKQLAGGHFAIRYVTM
jgi:hypothetical protein